MRYHTELSVDLGILKENFGHLKDLAPNNEVIFMIKAHAYGHGLVDIAQYASRELGASTFGVASLGEAVELRKKLPSMRSRLVVFSDTDFFWKETRELYLDYNIIPVISSLGDLEEFLDDRDFANTPLFLKLDTGMHRLGIDHQDSEKVSALLKSSGKNRINHLMTHFSSSFIKLKEGDRTYRQLENFLDAKKLFAQNGIQIDETSCANSGAIEQGIGLDESHIRPGLMLYGPASVFGNSSLWKGRNVSSLKTTVLKTFQVKKGTPIGYGAHVVHKDGVLVYAPIGYGDGFLTYYSKAKFKVEGLEALVLGRVNMDMCALFFEEEALGKFSVGDSIKIWEHDQNSLNEFAFSVGTIPYQVLTALSARIPRSYRL